MPDLQTEASARKVKTPGEDILFGFAMQELLNDGETFAGTPTVTCTKVNTTIKAASAGSTSDLTISASPIVNTATFVDDEGVTVEIGGGVQCRISGGLHGVDYKILVTCATTDSNTRELPCWLEVRDE